MARTAGRGPESRHAEQPDVLLLGDGVERLGAQHLDATEDIRVHLFTAAEVRELLTGGGIRQALMAAPLWRYAAEYGL